MDNEAFTSVRQLGTTKDGNVLALKNDTWFNFLYNTAHACFQFTPYTPPPPAWDAPVDLYSPSCQRMLTTHVKARKKNGEKTFILYLDIPDPFFKKEVRGAEAHLYDFLGAYRMASDRPGTYVHESPEHQQWNLTPNNYNQMMLCFNYKMIGMVVEPPAVRCISETATNTEIVALFKGRSQQFAARVILRGIKMRNAVFGSYGLLYGKPCVKQVQFGPAQQQEYKRECERSETSVQKPKRPRMCDRAMRTDIADKHSWDATHLERAEALALLTSKPVGSFVVYRGACGEHANALWMSVKVCKAGVLFEERAIVMSSCGSDRGKVYYKFAKDIGGKTTWCRSVAALIEPLYETTRVGLFPVLLRRMDYEV